VFVRTGATTHKEDRVVTNEYETIYILSPELTDEEVGLLRVRINGVIGQQTGKILRDDLWGKRKLAYEIKKQPKGIFIYLDYLCPATCIKELERNLRIIESVLKFQTIQLGKNVNVEKRVAESEADALLRAVPRKPAVVNLSDLDDEERPHFGHGENGFSDEELDRGGIADDGNLPEER